MQQHNMVILSQAENNMFSGVCRDYTGATRKGEERVRAHLKNWGKLIVFRCDGQPWWSTSLTPYKGTANTLSPFVVLTT